MPDLKSIKWQTSIRTSAQVRGIRFTSWLAVDWVTQKAPRCNAHQSRPWTNSKPWPLVLGISSKQMPSHFMQTMYSLSRSSLYAARILHSSLITTPYFVSGVRPYRENKLQHIRCLSARCWVHLWHLISTVLWLRFFNYVHTFLLPPVIVTLTKRRVYTILLYARPFGCFFFSWGSTWDSQVSPDLIFRAARCCWDRAESPQLQWRPVIIDLPLVSETWLYRHEPEIRGLYPCLRGIDIEVDLESWCVERCDTSLSEVTVSMSTEIVPAENAALEEV